MRTPAPVVIALGSNLGDRRRNLRAAVALLPPIVRVVRLSRVWESNPVDCPPEAGAFLNMALSGVTTRSPAELLAALHEIERRLGRRRRRQNEPRVVDLDVIFYGARLARGSAPLLPHPRYGERAFVLAPIAELGLDWTVAGTRVSRLRGAGDAWPAGNLY